MWRGITKSRRKEIIRARRRGITVEKSIDAQEYQRILNHVRSCLGIGTMTVDRNPTYLFVARTADGEAVAGNNFYTCENKTRLRTHTAGTLRLIPEKKVDSGLAHALLIWETIKWAKEHRFITYDFGGYAENGIGAYGKDVSGVNYFKKSFGGKIGPKIC